MADFRKPPGVDLAGYDATANKQTLTVSRYGTVALWGGGPRGEKLIVSLKDPAVATVTERDRQGDLRIFRMTGKKVGATRLEASLKDGATWAAMQIEVVMSRGKRIVVHLESQPVEAFDSGVSVYQFICITGDASHPTDPGTFKIDRKFPVYRSKKYNAQMNYAMFFTADGKAIHQYHGASRSPQSDF